MTPQVAGLSQARRLLPRTFTWSPTSFFAASLSSFLPPFYTPKHLAGSTRPDAARFLPSLRGEGTGCRSGTGRAGSLLSALHVGGWASEGRCQVCDLPCPGLPGKSSSAAQVRLDLRAVRVLQPGLGPFPEQIWPLDTPVLSRSFPWGSLAAGGGLSQERIKSSALRPSPVSSCLLLPSPEPVLPHMALGPKSHRACPLNRQGHSPRDAELPGPHSTPICIEL